MIIEEEILIVDDNNCEKLFSYDEWVKINDNKNAGSFEDSSMNVMTSEEVDTSTNKDQIPSRKRSKRLFYVQDFKLKRSY